MLLRGRLLLVYPYPPGPLSPHAEKGGKNSSLVFLKSLSVYGEGFREG